MFYCDCILRGYDVETTTEVTGMRPDILQESILITKLDFQMLLHVACHAMMKMHTLTAKEIALMRPPLLFQPPEECAVLTSSGFMYTTEQKWTFALLKLLDDINAPDYAFRLIIDWACLAKNDGYIFYHQVVSHGIQMLNLCSSLYQMPPFFAHLFNPCSV
jgi:hypothetical protein